jgi:hypothetical protein
MHDVTILYDAGWGVKLYGIMEYKACKAY